jgi:hypothetical protein
VAIEAPACTDGQPRRDVDVVLHEHSGYRKRVRKLRKIPWTERIAFECHPGHYRVPPGRRADGHFAEGRLVSIALADVTELVIVPLLHRSPARDEQEALPDEDLNNGACVHAPGAERFAI